MFVRPVRLLDRPASRRSSAGCDEAVDREHEEGELSFWIAEAAHGQGYVTDAAVAVVDYALHLGRNRVCAYHMVRNTAPARALGKIAMSQEGACAEGYGNGESRGCFLWAVLRKDWVLTP